MAKASGILQYLEEDEDVEWDAKNQVYIKGRKLEGSNVTDLMHRLIRKRKAVPDPEGYQELLQHLKERNAPKELIGHDPVFTTPPQSPQKGSTLRKGPIKEEDGWASLQTP